MEPFVSFLVVILVFVVIAVPIMAILAFIRSSNAQKSTNQIPQLIARIYDLEQCVKALDQRAPSATSGAQELARTPVPTQAPAEPVSSPVSQAPLSQPLPPTAATLPAPVTPPIPPTPSAPSRVEEKRDLAPATAGIESPLTTGTHPPAPPSPPRFTPSSPPPPHHGGESDVESTIAGRWFNYVGILAITLAAAFFLKYAFDNNWIGPGGRVAIGLIVGGAMYPLSQWVLNRGYRYYSEGLTGLGAAILYLSLWAGWNYYHIFEQSYAFVLMIVVTALTVAVAIGRNSERIAALALIGGLLTPALVSTGQNAEIALCSYLAALGGAMLAIAWMRKWRSIAPLQFAGTLLYFWTWYGEFYAPRELGVTVLFSTLFFVLFAALPAVRATREGEMPPLDIGIVLTNAFQYLIALRLMLWKEHRWGLTFAVLALAAAHLLAERALPRKPTRAHQLAKMLYAGLALTFATLAIPIRLEGKWITIAFAVEAALLIWSGLRVRSLALRSAGFVLFGIVAIRISILTVSAPTPVTFLLNERFLTMAICAVCGVAAFLFAQQSDCELDAVESQCYFFLEIAANFCFLLALSMDVWDLFGRMPSLGIDRAHAQQLALSMLWIVYALILIVAGALRKSAAIRWQGLVLLSVAILKVFFFDLSFLTRFYRIVSFFVLGIVLLLVSFCYQRRLRTPPSPNQP